MPGGSASTRFADVRHFDSVPSTNSVAAELARPGLVVVAGHQHAGRGRLGRTWEAPPGSSLLVSVVLDVSWVWDGRPQLATLALGLAASDACSAVAGVRPMLKWPNDLVVGDGGDGKVGGILAETVPHARAFGGWCLSLSALRAEAADLPLTSTFAPRGGRRQGGRPPKEGLDTSLLVAGLGLNVRWGDRPPPPPGTSLDALGADVEPLALLAPLLERLDARLDQGPDALLDGYRARCATLGRAVRIEQAGRDDVEGTAVGVTPEGHLVVRDVGGDLCTVVAGDVVHLRPG